MKIIGYRNKVTGGLVTPEAVLRFDVASIAGLAGHEPVYEVVVLPRPLEQIRQIYEPPSYLAEGLLPLVVLEPPKETLVSKVVKAVTRKTAKKPK